jgi:hypothetical protein
LANSAAVCVRNAPTIAFFCSAAMRSHIASNFIRVSTSSACVMVAFVAAGLPLWPVTLGFNRTVTRWSPRLSTMASAAGT